MKILQVISDRERRGAQVFAVSLAGVLRARGHDVTCTALVAGARPEIDDVDVLGTRARAPSTLRALRSLMRHHDATIANASTTLAACAMAGAGSRGPFVYRQIGDVRVWANGAARRARVVAFTHQASAVVALGPMAADAVNRHLMVPSDRITVIPNGASATSFQPASHAMRSGARARFGLDPHRPVLLYAGALSAEKNVGTAIVGAARTGAQLLVVGAGPEERALHLQAARLGADVYFTGTLDDARPGYAAADVVVLPSKTESMPAVLIEAGMSGLPVVATAVGDVGAVVDHGVTGLLVPPDDATAFIDAVASMLQTPERWPVMGAAARARCTELFDLEQIATQWESLLARVAPNAAHGAGRGHDPQV